MILTFEVWQNLMGQLLLKVYHKTKLGKFSKISTKGLFDAVVWHHHNLLRLYLKLQTYVSNNLKNKIALSLTILLNTPYELS